jgi:hypothetical protein
MEKLEIAAHKEFSYGGDEEWNKAI